jgi:MerR family transcriptional regulator, light-induced transcriptional regulator
MDSSAEPAWTAGQVARHLGIAESTLRSWHRRYGIGPHGSEPGRYRRYSEADVARLQRMQDLINLGMLASEAAQAVQAGEGEAVSAERDVADLVAAARAADSERCRVVLDSVLARRGVVEAWESVCRPALVLVDADQRVDPDCIDIEHALSWAMLGALHRAPRPPILPGTPLVVLACVEAEHHTLPLAALAAALGTHRIPIRMLGAATPTQSLIRAVRETAPAALVLWSQRPGPAGPRILQLLSPYPPRLFTAGPGWTIDGPAGVAHLASLTQALAVLTGVTPLPPGPGGATPEPGAPPEPGATPGSSGPPREGSRSTGPRSTPFPSSAPQSPQ